MTELRGRMFANVALDLLPVVLIIADVLAIRTDRQNALQLLDLHERLFEFKDTLGETLLQLDDACADLHARAQFIAVERLDDVIVRAGVESLHDVSLAAFGS